MSRFARFLVDELKVCSQDELRNRVFFVSAREILSQRLRSRGVGTPSEILVNLRSQNHNVLDFSNFLGWGLSGPDHGVWNIWRELRGKLNTYFSGIIVTYFISYTMLLHAPGVGTLQLRWKVSHCMVLHVVRCLLARFVDVRAGPWRIWLQQGRYGWDGWRSKKAIPNSMGP